jgi:hypothetical protein
VSLRKEKFVRKRASWCAKEFASAHFGDPRLQMRLIKTAEQLAKQPEKPINQACESWADTKAAYRLFANDKIDPSEILRSHQQKTLERCKAYPLILAIQDTTFLNYTDHPVTCGLGHIGTNQHRHSQGLLMHSIYAVSPEGLPLGLLGQKFWSRPKRPKHVKSKGARDRRDLAIEGKESYCWLEALSETACQFSNPAQVLTVGDRGADIYEFMAHARALGSPFLIRAARNRAVIDEEAEEISYLWEEMEQQPVSGTLEVEVPARPKEAARMATVGVRFAPITLRNPRKRRLPTSDDADSLKLYAVFVQEIDPPKQSTALAWMLLTPLPVNSFHEAAEKVRWYKLRWSIETFHKILKSGCRIEECRLESADRLERYIALFCVIAWRLHWLTLIQRQQPETPCTQALSDPEWKALYCRIHRTRTLPKQLPTLRQAVRWIAQLGGFLGRKGDGEPGVITLWRGWQRLMDLTEGYELFSDLETCG